MFSHKSFLLLIILFLATSAKAQEAYQIAEVTQLRCDLGEIPQLDDAAQQIIEKNAKASIVIYGNLKGKAQRYADYIIENFVNYRIPVNERRSFSVYYGGYSEKPRMDIWIVPKWAEEPKTDLTTYGNDVVKYDAYGYWLGECPDERIPALRKFAEELKQNPNLTGYLIVYYEDAKPPEEATLTSRKGQHKSSNEKRFLTMLGIDASRIFLTDVNYNKTSYARYTELWIVPQGAAPPKPTSTNND